jgi:alpha-glucosidase (family GH31 glycosyl hydrolase)
VVKNGQSADIWNADGGTSSEQVPLHVFHFGTFWMREFNWCDFEWDSRTFPDPRGMLARLKARGLRICGWISPYIEQRSPLFAQGQARATCCAGPAGTYGSGTAGSRAWRWTTSPIPRPATGKRPSSARCSTLFTKLKARLMPYLYRASLQAHTEGVPMMRAMVLEFPDDPACTHPERQYMLGDDLLVAPVFRADGDVSYYVPDGTWTHVLTGAEVTGPRWHREQHSFMSVPLLARPGSVIPVGAVEDRPDYDYADGVTLQVYQLAAGVPAGCRCTSWPTGPAGPPGSRSPTHGRSRWSSPCPAPGRSSRRPRPAGWPRAAGRCCWPASMPSAG